MLFRSPYVAQAVEVIRESGLPQETNALFTNVEGDLAAVLKVGIALVVGGLGIWYAVNFGFANDMAPETFLPALDSNSLTYLSIILFNFMGFEVITTYVGSMENPNKQIPRAIIAGGIAIAALYLFSSFGIGAAIPAMDISLDSRSEEHTSNSSHEFVSRMPSSA